MVGSIQYSPVAASSLESFISLHDKPGRLCTAPRRAKKKLLTINNKDYDTIENSNLKINLSLQMSDYALALSSGDTDTDAKIKRRLLETLTE